MAIATPLSVSGRWITDANGNRVKLAGVNWAGAHQDAMTPGGLNYRHRNDIAAQIADWGFNSVRFPFALQTVTSASPVATAGLAANTDLAGSTPWQVYTACVQALTEAGLMVIPNCHLLFEGWPVPETTEVLTRSGWKHCSEVLPDEDETLGYADGELRWTRVIRVQRRGKQKVIRFGSERWSTVCTPDHRWLTQEAFPRNDRPVEWGPVTAEPAQVAWHSKRTPGGIAGARRLVLTAYAEGGKSECSPDEAAVAAWLLSDGSVVWRPDGGVTAYIAQSEGKYADEIRILLDREQACSSEALDTHASMRRTPVHRFRIRAAYVRRLWDILGLRDGLLPFVTALSREARAAWFDAWRKAEGSAPFRQIYQNAGEKLDAVALTAFLEGNLVQPLSSERHCGVNVSRHYFVSNGPNSRPVFQDAGWEDVWCPTTVLGSWVARDKDGRIFLTGNCCSADDGNGLWWNGNWPAARFTSDWVTVATAFAGNPLVIGYDLKNEPRPATISGTTYTPSWGDGNAKTDFCQLYTSTATAIQAVDARALFFCEGLSYAADLTGTKTKLVTPATGKCVVYSMHDYSWYHPAGQSQANYVTAMDNAGGFLLTAGTAPVWIGEFGTGNDSLAAVGASSVIGASSPSDANLGAWFSNFLAWAGQADVDWCWWQLDGTMCQGTTPQVNKLQWALGDRATYGLFAQDWMGASNPALLRALQAIQAPKTGPGV